MPDYAEILRKRAEQDAPARSRLLPLRLLDEEWEATEMPYLEAKTAHAAAVRALDSYDSQPEKPARKLNAPNPRDKLVATVETAAAEVERLEAARADCSVHLRIAYPTAAQHTRAVVACNGEMERLHEEIIRECLVRVEDRHGEVIDVPTEVILSVIRNAPMADLGDLFSGLTAILNGTGFPTSPGR